MRDDACYGPAAGKGAVARACTSSRRAAVLGGFAVADRAKGASGSPAAAVHWFLKGNRGDSSFAEGRYLNKRGRSHGVVALRRYDGEYISMLVTWRR